MLCQQAGILGRNQTQGRKVRREGEEEKEEEEEEEREEEEKGEGEMASDER